MHRSTCTDIDCPWEPVERFLSAEQISYLMHMGDTVANDGTPIRLFKHDETRLYLNVSIAPGPVRTYIYTGDDGYEPIGSEAAVARVFTARF